MVDAQRLGDVQRFGGHSPDRAGEFAERVHRLRCIHALRRVAVVAASGVYVAERPARVGRVVPFADLVNRGEVARLLREVEPLLVRAAHPVGDGLGQPVRLRPNHLSAQDQPEVVDAADGVTPRDADQVFGF